MSKYCCVNCDHFGIDISNEVKGVCKELPFFESVIVDVTHDSCPYFSHSWGEFERKEKDGEL